MSVVPFKKKSSSGCESLGQKKLREVISLWVLNQTESASVKRLKQELDKIK